MHKLAFEIVVDDAGKAWKANCPEWRARYDLDHRAGDLVSYLVRNLGHIRIRFFAHNAAVHLTFRAGFIPSRTVETAADLLLRTPADRYLVEALDQGSFPQMATDVEDVISILVNNAEGGSVLKRPRFLRQKLSVQRLALESRFAGLRRYFQVWKRVLGNWDFLDPDLVLFAPDARYCQVAMLPGRAEFRRIGSGYTGVRSLVAHAEGERVDDMADREYGGWTSECLFETAYDKIPKFELVEATLRPPGGRPIRSRYERLLLPWRSAKGIFVSSAAVSRVLYAAAPAT